MTDGNPSYDPLKHPQLSDELLHAAQTTDAYPDAKTFVDSTPAEAPAVIRERFRAADDDEEFFNGMFSRPETAVSDDVPRNDIHEYIDATWSVLTKQFTSTDPNSTLISLPRPHVVAGGRFREAYYWDSYFTAEGLAVTDRVDSVKDMAVNFSHLVDKLGFIPNGTRAYYTSRSQPPLFYRLVNILYRERGIEAVAPHLTALKDEHDFWTSGSESVAPGTAQDRVVNVDGTVLNRYWDNRTEPRPEAYNHDRQLAAQFEPSRRPRLFRHLRAACESGWDFSSRWMRDPTDPASIRTADLIPVDLNAYLYEMESLIAEWSAEIGAETVAEPYREQANRRQQAVEEYCWNEEEGLYTDYDWQEGEQTDRTTLATVVPLFTGLASDERAEAVAQTLREKLLADGGLRTTLTESGEQWDKPHGWPPLQWMGVRGLQRYGFDDLAEEIAHRWLATISASFDEHGAMFERYNVDAGRESQRDGNYGVQIGFGWTNGVAVALEGCTNASM